MFLLEDFVRSEEGRWVENSRLSGQEAQMMT